MKYLLGLFNQKLLWNIFIFLLMKCLVNIRKVLLTMKDICFNKAFYETIAGVIAIDI
jgi:hypothetical protein